MSSDVPRAIIRLPDNLAAAKGIIVAVLVSVPVWALAVWSVRAVFG